MRWMLMVLALGAGGTAAYMGLLAKTSYSGYSDDQLAQLEAEFLRMGSLESGDGEASFDLKLIQSERSRRATFPIALGVAGLAFLAAILVPGSRRQRREVLRGDSDEDARLVAALGDPNTLKEGALSRAAALLGVMPNAPPKVIEAAFQARLAEYEDSRLEQLAPELRKVALEQREALMRARKLLVD